VLVRTIHALQRRRLAAALLGGLVEVAVVAAIGSDDTVAGVRGIGGETAVSLAVVGAVFAGPAVGATMALAGWATFFPLIAESAPGSIVALPVWTATALLVGQLSRVLVRAERGRIEAERDAQAAHTLRTPVATIHGLVGVLRLRGGDEELEKVVRALEDETERLLASSIFRRGA
jgi:signal transduction histidine kinase